MDERIGLTVCASSTFNSRPSCISFNEAKNGGLHIVISISHPSSSSKGNSITSPVGAKRVIDSGGMLLALNTVLACSRDSRSFSGHC